MKITIIAGARPNFMKIAPIIHALEKARKAGNSIDYALVHTGQHFDKSMSGDFFEQLGIPEPNANLACGGGSQAEQTANIMVKFEEYLTNNPTDLVLVVGDVTSTMACAIVAQKLKTKVAHVEAGIRSWDWSMPEEINRLVTDSISNYFFTTTEMANEHLIKSGVERERIFWVGNTMIDTLLANQGKFIKPVFWDEFNLKHREYFVMTLHRPANVDEKEQLKGLLSAVETNCGGLPVIFPVHPRTQRNIDTFGIDMKQIRLVSPMSYLEFNYIVEHSKGVITDSGGITEETTVMGVPCITLRDNTERPETVSIGTNELIGTNPAAIGPSLSKLLAGQWKKGKIPPLWDGKTSERIVDHLSKLK
jgi:UDP-N-acetylglucosamine 2-epimerase (non-hydrolysing)